MTGAEELTDRYGPNPQDVGAEDGTEDDFGDLIHDAVQILGLDTDRVPDDLWQAIQDAATNTDATDMDGFLDAILAVLPTTPL